MEVLIITVEFHNALSLIESLGPKGIYTNLIVVTDNNDPYLLHSKYVKKGWVCRTNEEFIPILLHEFEGNGTKTLLISCSDDATVVLDKHYDELKDNYYLPLTAFHGRQEELMSKQYMTSLAEEVGLNVPRSWLIQNGKSLPNNIEYPCITKPISSVAGSKEDNIRVCENSKELMNFLESGSHADVIQIQKYIDKEFEYQFMGCSFDDGNEILISGRTHIVRPNGRENVFFLRFDRVEPELKEVELKVRDFIRRVKHNGPFSVEFLQDKQGANFFMEMNMRNDGNAYCQTCGGMNIPYIMYLYYSGGDYKSEIGNSKVHEIYMVPEFEYLLFKLKGEFGWKEWFRNMRKADCCNTYFKNDKAPFLHFIKPHLVNFVKKRVRTLFGKVTSL